MSHQSGIVASQELRDFLAGAKDGSVRVIKIAIKDEKLELDHHDGPEKQPCYIFYRLDSKNDQGYQWVYLLWSPDNSHVRQKMLYASTRSTLKSEFGGGQIKEEIYGTVLSDVNFNGFKRHLLHQDAPAPLTAAEEELAEIKSLEVKAEISVDTKHQTMSGVHFPVSSDAQQRLLELKDGQLNYVQLSLDLKKETIELESIDDTTVATLPSRVPTDHARYHLFNFKHTHEGDYMESIVFIYSMPGYSCSIKERMLYSSGRAPFLDFIEQIGLEVAKKIEIDDGKELTEDFLQDEVHPKKNVAKQKFARPKGPGGRGPKRMTKPNPNGNGN
ncbi:unnamed protein product [Owenia fusiformis]|uniref:Twinfilin n=1 Tax=Owenia fusiformis TaxID=6347 RepID=A0A8S4NQ73_OWEFU|nr:unnamed protein product [Owenia fusiformis]